MLPFTAPLMTGVSDLLAVELLGVGCSIEAAAYGQFESHKQSEASGLFKEEAEGHF